MNVFDPCCVCGKRTKFMEINPFDELTFCELHSRDFQREKLKAFCSSQPSPSSEQKSQGLS